MFSTTRDDNNARAAKDTMTSEGGPTINEAKERVRHLRDDARDAAGAVKDDLEAVARRTGRHVRDLADSAGQNLGDLSETLKNTISQKPLKAGAVILGVGFVLGVLYRR